MNPEILFLIFLFIFGSMWGSFLGAFVYRYPRKINFVFPRSKCTQCNNVIPWYFNIPIISFIILRGRCGYCKVKYSPRYFICEILMGLHCLSIAPLSFSSPHLWWFSFQFVVGFVFLAHLFIDLEHQILPDALNLILAILFLVVSAQENPILFWLSGGAVGFFFPYLVTWVFYKLKGKIGLGGGDIKLYGALGLYLGVAHVVQTIFLSCLLGSIIALGLIGLKRMKSTDPIPFGPFILVVAYIQIFFPDFIDGLGVLPH